ncbi:MAG: hypothetical protein B7C24_07505 [Bacteroidetes bacterium 4572_77]|nr:MAG: hypothetical protein B7C24_07505 [Bacteroidetes bacterium 4572_77]
MNFFLFFANTKMRRVDRYKWGIILIGILWMGQGFSQSAFSKYGVKSFKHKRYQTNLQIEARGYFGFLYSHHTELEIFNAHFPAFEITLLKDTYGRKYWQRLHNYPIIGVSAFYTPLGKNKAIGQAFALYPFITFPIVKDEKNFVGFRFGLGLSYLTKTFHPIDNYKNIAIGSHVNVAINLMGEYRRKINESTELSFALSLIHFSNGSMATPNYGLNLPMASLGFSKRLGKPNDIINERRPSIPTFSYKPNKIYIYNITAGYATKNMGNVFGERFDVYYASVSVLKYFNEKSSIGISGDFSWDGSHKAMQEKKGIENPSFITVMRPGFSVAYELKISRLILGANLGIYWGGKEKSDGDFYEQLVVKYLVLDQMFVSVNLRAHMARAAFVSWGIGYRLQYDYGRR